MRSGASLATDRGGHFSFSPSLSEECRLMKKRRGKAILGAAGEDFDLDKRLDSVAAMLETDPTTVGTTTGRSSSTSQQGGTESYDYTYDAVEGEGEVNSSSSVFSLWVIILVCVGALALIAVVVFFLLATRYQLWYIM